MTRPPRVLRNWPCQRFELDRGRMRDQYIRAGNIRTRYRVAGQGEVPLVMLHGLSGQLEDWGGAARALSRDRRVVVFDLLGCGKTEKPVGCAYSPDEMMGHVIDLMDALGIEKADVNGWSMGGRIAIDLAHAVPGRIRRLVLTAPAGVGEDSIVNFNQPLLEVVGDVLTRPMLASWRILRNSIRRDRGMETVKLAGRRAVLAVDGGARRAFVRQLRSFMGPKGFKASPRAALLEKLPQINVPTRAIWGRGDMFVPARHAEVLTRLMPECGLVLLEQSGHMPQLERPVAYVRAISEFLE